MISQEPDDLLTLSEARKILGVSHAKMSRLLQKRVLFALVNPLDNREKLVSRRDVLDLIPKKAKAA